ncbi:hypothetical protein G6F57_020256 [Rhizopus arrhizus]|nr:hypothetical protein G6F57_020256 [Rhizopus arrhizus]
MRDVGVGQQRQPVGGAAQRDDAGQVLIQRIEVAAAGVRAEIARVGRQIAASRQAEEALPLRIGIGQQRDVAVQRAVGPAFGRQHQAVAHLAARRVEGAPSHVLDQREGHQRLEHRHFDRLAAAGLFAFVQGHGDGVGQRQACHLVGQDGVDVGGGAGVAALEVGQAAHGLDDVPTAEQ